MLRLATGRMSATLNRLGWSLFGVMLLIGLGQCFMPVTGQDEGELLVYPSLMAHGAMPYRDFWAMYPPATYGLLALLFKLGIPGLLAERGVSLIVRVLYIVLVNRLVTGRWSRFSWLATPIGCSLLFYEVNADMRAYPWVVGLPLLLLALERARRRPYLSAALFLGAGMFRYEFAFAGFLMLATLAILHWPDRLRRRHEATATAGLAVGTLTFCLMLNLASGGPAIQDTILEPFLYISPGRSLPLFPLHFGWWGLPLEVLILAGPPLAIVAGLTLRRPYIVASNLAALSLVQHFLQRADWAYLLWVGATVAPWLLVTAVELCQDEDDHEVRPSILGAWRPLGRRAAWAVRAALRYMGTAVAAWFSLLLLFLAIFYSPLSPVSATSVVRGPSLLVQNAGHTIIAGNVREARDDRAIISYLNTHGNPRQRVFIAPRALRYAIWNITALYYVLDLQPASKYLEMNPGVETRAPVQREIIHELRDCSWVILSTAGYWYEPNASHIPGGPLLQRFIDSHYAIVYRNPSYQVLRQLSGQKVG